jgi:hypothetical protein
VAVTGNGHTIVPTPLAARKVFGARTLSLGGFRTSSLCVLPFTNADEKRTTHRRARRRRPGELWSPPVMFFKTTNAPPVVLRQGFQAAIGLGPDAHHHLPHR